jgi:hypothetical protein
MKKIITLTILSIIFIMGFFVFLNQNQKNKNIVSGSFDLEKIKVATCPSCWEIAKNINSNKYEIIPTGSTAESIALLENKKVDMILAGQKLKPQEPKLKEVLIEEGYSFLNNQEATIFIDQLSNYNIYSDLDEEELKEKFPIEKIQTVSNVYEYLNKGIIITSWENTDYQRAEIVHVLKEDGSRVKLSRQPTIYYPDSCGDLDAQELALILNK